MESIRRIGVAQFRVGNNQLLDTLSIVDHGRLKYIEIVAILREQIGNLILPMVDREANQRDTVFIPAMSKSGVLGQGVFYRLPVTVPNCRSDLLHGFPMPPFISKLTTYTGTRGIGMAAAQGCIQP